MKTTAQHFAAQGDSSAGKVVENLLRSLTSVARVSSAELEGELRRVVLQPRRTKSLLRQLDQLREALVAASMPTEPVSGVHDVLPDLLQSRQVLDSAVFGQRLGWTRQALSKALKANRVFCLQSGGARYFPSFYADARYARRHLEAVSKLLGDVPGGAKWLFFTSPKGSLSRLTPLQALERGELLAVKAAAEGYAQR